MLKALAVIGAAYGDEGKGLITDYLAAQAVLNGSEVCVVRFNGGAQAGHTVTTPDGKRHVFHHFGSGTFRAASTYLSKFFVSNPLLFCKERKELVASFNIKAVVHVDPLSPITTPYDMMLNQFQEQQRDSKRHGSCGVGFNETLERECSRVLPYNYGTLLKSLQAGKEEFFAELKMLIDTYYAPRVKQLITDIALRNSAQAILENSVLQVAFYEACVEFAEHSKLTDFNYWKQLQHSHTFVFEGAQGLLLDQDHPNFPHVTRSNTGLANVISILEESGCEYSLKAYYITRAYATRHGAGPFEFARSLPYSINDPTNVPNPFQGTMRFGAFNLPAYTKATNEDINKAMQRTTNLRKFERVSVVTCVDQVCNEGAVYHVNSSGVEETCSGIDFVNLLLEQFDLFSLGPTARDVRSHDTFSLQQYRMLRGHV